ncbi:MAG: tRNA glutamyl-Q(34) synthetase GluQRS [Gammaproteobacteria bacterium]|nr:tRNA glutamyl-Q(34) synthetase GluQRS [Gammaproteobacteria bacterium]NIM73487.1 tRNA glutamyl-Q(34) synthetase GluQRS [Gammaproteobacteria bacterium]NIN39896.1 tRNA glutamyl-Q(34) synthetase GluQRS [Gammaproteobacteria bacterium]NIO25296.1 tRNA glutamyl-Q(34) synthetase GluQRS [Gammaproteobacteria bacterium]NIO65923.1 tRNA glutamyl-Q(34) synthetase GluQRS [Gammaproteobacteria bacterium]
MASDTSRQLASTPRNRAENPRFAQTESARGYRGRFAPSPTGPLHFGSIIAAVGSYLQARRCRGEWLVRIDDLDGPRTEPGAANAILAELERLGLYWDGDVCYQSTRTERYRDGLERLREAGWTFPCGCSRKDFDGVYPGTCRDGLVPGRRARTRRMRVCGISVELDDAVQGRCNQRLPESVGDFVIRRADGIFAYHLAVVVDDAEFGITDIVRGADLLDSTPRQIHLQRCLGLPTPGYAHLPVAVNAVGQKLSKQTYAEPVTGNPAVPLVIDALEFLGQQPERALNDASLDELWSWAIAHWRMERVPRLRAIHWPPGQAVPHGSPISAKLTD